MVLRLWVDLEGWTEAGSRVGWREGGGGLERAVYRVGLQCGSSRDDD